MKQPTTEFDHPLAFRITCDLCGPPASCVERHRDLVFCDRCGSLLCVAHTREHACVGEAPDA